MNKRIKQIIFDKLYKDLSHVEIIPHKDSVWFIDRKEKYWYLEYKKNGALYWRWQFFPKYFNLFSLEEDEFEPIISEWVEEVLNCKVVAPAELNVLRRMGVEEVLNCKVVTSISPAVPLSSWVEEALNCKVVKPSFTRKYSGVEEVLNYKVVMPSMASIPSTSKVEEALNCKVTTQGAIGELHFSLVDQVLNAK